MASMTYFVVLPFTKNDGGELTAGEPVQVHSGGAEVAKRRAQTVAAKQGGAVAFSRSGDPAVGEYDDAVVLGRYGEVPPDLTEFTT